MKLYKILFFILFAQTVFADRNTDLEIIKQAYKQENHDEVLALTEDYLSKYAKGDRDLVVLMRGEILYLKGEYAQSTNLFAKFKQDFSGSKFLDRVYFYLGCSYFKQNQFVKSLDQYGRLLVEFPSSFFGKTSQYWIAEAYYRLGEYVKAIKFYLNTISIYPDTEKAVRSVYAIGTCFYKLKKYEESIKYMDRVLENSHGTGLDVYALYTKAKCLAFLSRFQESFVVYDILIKDNKNQKLIEKCIIEKASLLVKQKKYDQAIDSFKQFIQQYPTSKYKENALYTIALCYFKDKNFVFAIDYYDRYILEYPQNVLAIDALLNKGVSYYNLQKYDDALKVYDNIIKKYPKNVSAYYNRAWTLVRLNKQYQAFKLFKAITEKFPNNILTPDVLFWMADYFLEQGKALRAIECLNTIVQRYEDTNVAGDAYVKLSKIYLDKNDTNKSLVYLEKIKLENVLYDDVQLRKVDIYLDQKRYKDALDILLGLKDKDLKHDIGQEVFLKLATVCMHEKELIKALEYYKKAQYGPNTELIVQAILGQGQVYMFFKDWKRALEIFTSLYNKSTSATHLDIYYSAKLSAARCCEKLKDLKTAVILYDDVIREGDGRYGVVARYRRELLNNQ